MLKAFRQYLLGRKYKMLEDEYVTVLVDRGLASCENPTSRQRCCECDFGCDL